MQDFCKAWEFIAVCKVIVDTGLPPMKDAQHLQPNLPSDRGTTKLQFVSGVEQLTTQAHTEGLHHSRLVASLLRELQATRSELDSTREQLSQVHGDLQRANAEIRFWRSHASQDQDATCPLPTHGNPMELPALWVVRDYEGWDDCEAACDCPVVQPLSMQVKDQLKVMELEEEHGEVVVSCHLSPGCRAKPQPPEALQKPPVKPPVTTTDSQQPAPEKPVSAQGVHSKDESRSECRQPGSISQVLGCRPKSTMQDSVEDLVEPWLPLTPAQLVQAFPLAVKHPRSSVSKAGRPSSRPSLDVASSVRGMSASKRFSVDVPASQRPRLASLSPKVQRP